jgi:hypothetical protein
MLRQRRKGCLERSPALASFQVFAQPAEALKGPPIAAQNGAVAGGGGVAGIRREFNFLFLAWMGTALAAWPMSDANSSAPQDRATASPTPAGRPADRNALLRLEHAILPAGRMLVRVTFREELAKRPSVTAGHYPSANIVVDFPDFANESGSDIVEVHQRELRSLQLVRAGNRLRLIVHLTRPVPYEISTEDRQLLITLQPSQAAN